MNSTTLIAFLYLVTPFSWLVNKPSLKSVHRNQLCRNEMIIQNCVGCELYTRNFDSQKLKTKIPKFHLFSKRSLDVSKPRWSWGSVPSSHAIGQWFEPRSRQYYFIRRSLSWFGLASTPVESLPNFTPPSC